MATRNIIGKIKNRGIGLLELMLSLAIIAILLIMAVRYYQSANASQQISSAADMVNAVRSAMKNYYNDNAGNSFSTSTTGVALNDLITAGYLPPSFGNNPWNGTIGLSTGTSTCSSTTKITPSTTYDICMSSVPTNNCAQLVVKLQATMNGNLGESAACTSEILTATYAYG